MEASSMDYAFSVELIRGKFDIRIACTIILAGG